MGESCIRGNVSHGDGVYRSTDAGKTWTHVGLRDTRQIGRDPRPPAGPRPSCTSPRSATRWGRNAERGVFRSRDGGKTLDEGRSSWTRRRAPSTSRWTRPTRASSTPRSGRRSATPWSLESGGPGSGLWKSTDGGDTWKKLDGQGPAEGHRGARSASPSRPPESGARLRDRSRPRRAASSAPTTAGATWERTQRRPASSGSAPGTTRTSPPTRRTPTPSTSSTCSCSGRTTAARRSTTIGVPHGDNHDLWIDPEDPRRMIEGNDGGADGHVRRRPQLVERRATSRPRSSTT